LIAVKKAGVQLPSIACTGRICVKLFSRKPYSGVVLFGPLDQCAKWPKRRIA
jgi:hypothetical protein